MSAAEEVDEEYDPEKDPFLYKILVTKIDEEARDMFEMYRTFQGLTGGFGALDKWIEKRIELLESRNLNNLAVKALYGRSKEGDKKFVKAKSRDYAALHDKEASSSTDEEEARHSGEEDEMVFAIKEKEKCEACDETHWLGRCPKYLEKNQDERKRFLSQNERCFRCIGKGHLSRACNKKCKICNERHHWSLCYKNIKDKSSYVLISHSKRLVSLRVIKIRVRNATNPKRVIDVNALYDTGCSGLLLDQLAGEELRLQGYPVKITTTTAYNQKIVTTAFYANVLLQNVQGTVSIKSRARVGSNPAGGIKGIDWHERKDQYKHLRDLQIEPLVGNGEVRLIVGIDQARLIRNEGTPDIKYPGPGEGPEAVKTPFGWVIGGVYLPKSTTEEMRHQHNSQALEFIHQHPNTFRPTPEVVIGAGACTLIDLSTNKELGLLSTLTVQSESTLLTKDQKLSKLVDRWLHVEGDQDKGSNDKMSIEADYIRTRLEQGRERDDEGRYIIPCTWREGEPNFADNRHYVLDSFRKMEKGKYWKDPKIRQAFTDKVNDYVKKGYVAEVEDLSEVPVKCKYLPTFPVIDWSKDTTPLRPVFDGARKTPPDFKSLNDALLPGPNLSNDLPTVVTGMRRAPIIFGVDIREMFLQIKMPQKDTYMHMFVYRENPMKDFKTYRFLRHPFGSAGSPCVAVFTAKRLATDYEQKYPRAANLILSSSIVDDIMSSAATEEEAVKIITQLREIFGSARMKAGKIFSNSQRVLESFPEEDRAAKLQLVQCDMDQDPKLSTLGLSYHPKDDTIGYKMEILDWEGWTPRKILQIHAR